MSVTLDELTKASIVSLILFACLLKYILSKRDEKAGDGLADKDHYDLRNRYLIIYALAVFGDWLQGPYVYRLYLLHGLKETEIHQLFVIGFASSCVVGPFSGALWDVAGRKRGILCYGILYSLCCLLTAYGSTFPVLIVGRVLGGLSTAILFSAFESWLVGAAQSIGLTSKGLDTVFTQQTVLNSILAVLSGLVAQFLADYVGVELVFMLAALVLVVTSLLCAMTLSENKGEGDANFIQSLKSGTEIVLSSWPIASLGVIQALFEGSMYAFVLMWTPALSIETDDIPHGLIFASLMLSVMVGSLLNDLFKPKLTFILGVASLSLGLVTVVQDGLVRLILFSMFEGCVGAFWPIMAGLRSKYVPENARCAVLSIFR